MFHYDESAPKAPCFNLKRTTNEPSAEAQKRPRPEHKREASQSHPTETDYQSAFDALVMCATQGYRGEPSAAECLSEVPPHAPAPAPKSRTSPVSQSRAAPRRGSAPSGSCSPATDEDLSEFAMKTHASKPQACPSGEVCALCGRQRRDGEDFRDVRNIHVHWARLMEFLSNRHYLSEWTTRRQYYAFDPAIKLEKHFKCFSHDQVTFAFDGLANGKRCHKHCLHAFNFTVKTRFEEFSRATGYTGNAPDFVKFSKTDMPASAVVSDKGDVSSIFPRLYAPVAAASPQLPVREGYMTMTAVGPSMRADSHPEPYFPQPTFAVQGYGYPQPQFAYAFHPDPSYMAQYSYPRYVYPWGAYPGVDAVHCAPPEVNIVGRE